MGNGRCGQLSHEEFTGVGISESRSSGRSPEDLGTPPLKAKTLLESKPWNSSLSVRGLAVEACL